MKEIIFNVLISLVGIINMLFLNDHNGFSLFMLIVFVIGLYSQGRKIYDDRNNPTKKNILYSRYLLLVVCIIFLGFNVYHMFWSFNNDCWIVEKVDQTVFRPPFWYNLCTIFPTSVAKIVRFLSKWRFLMYKT